MGKDLAPKSFRQNFEVLSLQELQYFDHVNQDLIELLSFYRDLHFLHPDVHAEVMHAEICSLSLSIRLKVENYGNVQVSVAQQ